MHINLHSIGKRHGVDITDDDVVNLARAIVYSGVVECDIEFLSGEWCELLLDNLGCNLSGLELLAAYQRRKESKKHGKR